MADTLQIELVAADRTVWSGQAREVIARTVDGDLGVLRGHAPLLALLSSGVVMIETDEGATVHAAVEDGFISVANDRVSILSEDAYLASEISVAAAEAALEAATAAEDFAGIRWAEARLHAVELDK